MATVTSSSAQLPRTSEDEVLRTWVRSLEDLPAAPPARRRTVSTSTAEERTILVGSMAAGLALAWVICFRLLPWGNPLAFTLSAFLLFLATLTATTAAVSPGPAVVDRLASALVTGGAAVVGIALVTTVGFTFLRGMGALPHLNMFTHDMAGTGPRAPLSQG
ncbi:MAG TPA: hypothetical protein VFW79_12250, partial [Cellulomonas sp.]|uniref:hypothetical protein n=1 Tax=Cellulomonas sp. TaxID=40001 RepID=UPI002E44A5FE|nr:hypothetical protein [Cellulomonas sp.]